MKSVYGDNIVYMIAIKAAYSVPNHGQIPREFNEQTFYVYNFVTDKLVDSGLTIQLDVIQAGKFAHYNNLKIISEQQREFMIERWKKS